MFTCGQTKIQELYKKYVYKVIAFTKVITLKKVVSSIQLLNFSFVDNIKHQYPDKAYEKSCLVIHNYNDIKKNLILMYLLKILRVS